MRNCFSIKRPEGAGLRRFLAGLLLALVAANNVAASELPSLSIDRERATRLGDRIWRNESNRSIDGLTAWNKGEEFASLGIGHFIWYPEGVPQKFQESFPKLLRSFREHAVTLPAWLATARDPDCPWPSRAAFLDDFQSSRMKSLRKLLTETIDIQSMHIAERLTSALPKLMQTAPPSRKEEVKDKFLALFASDGGLYAMVDYVNFKGEGVSPTERYQGVGWGLLQVLLEMPVKSPEALPSQFARAAAYVLERRIELSPPERGESRWRRGWMRRVDTYRYDS